MLGFDLSLCYTIKCDDAVAQVLSTDEPSRTVGTMDKNDPTAIQTFFDESKPFVEFA